MDEEICFDSNKNKHSERQTYIVMSIPGLNKWVKEQSKCTETNVQKFNLVTHNDNMNKRSLGDTDIEKMDCSEPVAKKEKILTNDSDMNISNVHLKVQNILSEEHILNFPIPIDGGKVCIVKVNYINYAVFCIFYIFLNFKFFKFLLYRFMMGQL